MDMTQVAGSHNVGQVILFALSTCGWCRKTRQLLEANNVQYEYIYVDLLQGAVREEALREMAKWTDRQAFPTVIINGSTVIVGYDEDKLKKGLQL